MIGRQIEGQVGRQKEIHIDRDKQIGRYDKQMNRQKHIDNRWIKSENKLKKPLKENESKSYNKA